MPRKTPTPTPTPTPTSSAKKKASTASPRLRKQMEAPQAQIETDGGGTRDLLARARAALVEKQKSVSGEELQQRTRAKTPIALTLQIISCAWAVEKWDGDHTAPVEYSFPTRRCHEGKQVPDQDCRFCRYVKIIPYGVMDEQLPMHQRRYPDHGLIIPIPDEDAATVVGTFLRDGGMHPLRKPHHELHYLEGLVLRLEAQVAADERAALENQQAGRPSPIR